MSLGAWVLTYRLDLNAFENLSLTSCLWLKIRAPELTFDFKFVMYAKFPIGIDGLLWEKKNIHFKPLYVLFVNFKANLTPQNAVQKI